ncbi:MAG: hypothetical protein AB7U78_25175 [Hyphomicrobiaceae bacterium]
MIQSVTIVALVVTLSIAGPPSATAEAQRHDHTWHCNAYGYGGARETWKTVFGKPASSKERAKQSALDDCTRAQGLEACRSSGCWP